MTSRDDEPELKIGRPPESAGGFGAVFSVARTLRRETGLGEGARMLLKMNQQTGFDCPGCAWPEPHHRTPFEFCENGAKAFAEEATDARATPEVFAERSVDALRELSDFELGGLGRITHPLLLDEGSRHYLPLSWDDAFAMVGEELRDLATPDRAVFYTSGRTSNEAAFLYQLLGRKLGTNNFPDCSNMCHESSGVGLSEVVGVGKGTVGIEDFGMADLIFVIGQNPGTNHPRMLGTLREASRRGAVIVSINPLIEAGLRRFKHPQKVGDMLGAGVEIASEFMQVRVGGDAALFAGLIKALFELEAERPGEVLDGEFIEMYTTGLDELRAAAEAESWETIVRESGIEEPELRRMAELYARSSRVIACWAMGITQHRNAVANVQQVTNLMLLRGNLGKPGAGLCPVRGHSNVQGDRTVGIHHAPKEAFLSRLGEAFEFEPSRRRGHDTVEAIRAMIDGETDVFVSMGGNFYSATPDTDAVGGGLERCGMTVHVSTKVNRAHLYPGRRSLILPCLGRTETDRQAGGEQFVTVEDSMSMVHASRGAREPVSDALLSEPAIVVGIARHALGEDWSEWLADYDRVRDLIESVVPGFERYNERVRSERGFRLPNSARELDFSGIGGRARFTAHSLPDLRLPDGRYRLMTMRSHDQYNTTIYGLDDRYRGIYRERRVVLMNEKDMASLELSSGERVDVVSEFEGEAREVRGFAVVPYDIPRGCAGAYFPEANPLVPLESVAEKSGTPTSKSLVIRIDKSKEPK